MSRRDRSNVLVEEVKKLPRQWMESYVRSDIAFLEQHLAGDYTNTFPDGTVLDKKARSHP